MSKNVPFVEKDCGIIRTQIWSTLSQYIIYYILGINSISDNERVHYLSNKGALDKSLVFVHYFPGEQDDPNLMPLSPKPLLDNILDNFAPYAHNWKKMKAPVKENKLSSPIIQKSKFR